MTPGTTACGPSPLAMSVIPTASGKHAQAGRVKPRQLKAENVLVVSLPLGRTATLACRITPAPSFSCGGFGEGASPLWPWRCHTVRARWSLVNLANKTDRGSKYR